MTHNSAEAQHHGEVREQLMHALGYGAVHIAVVRQSGGMILGDLQGNRIGGNDPHVFGELTVRTADGQTLTIDFQDGNLWTGADRGHYRQRPVRCYHHMAM